MKTKIIKLLKQIEEEKDINILFASLGGSRGYGINNKDSDYDVRFIYVQNDPNYYSKIFRKPKNEVISKKEKNKIEFTGWDLRKGLELLFKDNYTIYEWTKMKTKYINNTELEKDIKQLSQPFNWEKEIKHNSSRGINTTKKKRYHKIHNTYYAYIQNEYLEKYHKLDTYIADEMIKKLDNTLLNRIITKHFNNRRKGIKDSNNVITDIVCKRLINFRDKPMNKVEKKNIDDFDNIFLKWSGNYDS